MSAFNFSIQYIVITTSDVATLNLSEDISNKISLQHSAIIDQQQISSLPQKMEYILYPNAS